jgi:catechol 2,3-dioxygenase-like lactoylglutathione lyase family enzyme
MPVQRVDFVGLRTDHLKETVALFRDVLNIPVTRQSDGLVGFRLADGTVLELYGPSEDFHVFFTTGPVVAFRVDDFPPARGAMIEAGVQFLGDVQSANGHFRQHFRVPDGTILEISGPTAVGPVSESPQNIVP